MLGEAVSPGALQFEETGTSNLFKMFPVQVVQVVEIVFVQEINCLKTQLK